MAINLKKGQSIVLEKQKYNLSKVTLGLGWDVAPPPPSGGFFKKLLSSISDSPDFDLDGFAIFLGGNDKLQDDDDVIYFGNLKFPDGSVEHTGDNLTGEGDGDDEQIIIQLNTLSDKYQKIILAANIFESRARNQHFGLVKNAYVRAMDADQREIARFDLSQSSEYDGKACMILGELQRQGDNWSFRGMGDPIEATDINQACGLYL